MLQYSPKGVCLDLAVLAPVSLLPDHLGKPVTQKAAGQSILALCK